MLEDSMQRPESMEMLFMRKKSRKTRIPGIRKIGDGVYRVRFKALDPRTGLYREVDRLIEGVKNLRDARKQREELRSETEVKVEKRKPERLKDYARSWLTGKLPEIKASTADHYAAVLDSYVLPELGDFYVDVLTRQDVLDWRDAQKGKPATVNGRLRVLKTLLRDAQVELGLAANPAERVSALREKRSEDDPNCLSAKELGNVLETAKRLVPNWYPLFATLAMTGMRFGEATALKWSDIDKRAGVIHVCRSQWRGQVDTTKTGSSRTVPLPKALEKTLSEYRRSMVKQQGPGLADGWVFPGSTGELLHPGSSVNKPLQKVVKAAGITRRFTIHGFRRSFNNLLRQVASGEVVRSMTGHVTEQMTEHYSHVDAAEKSKAVNQALRLVSRTKRATKKRAKVGTKVGTASNRLTADSNMANDSHKLRA